MSILRRVFAASLMLALIATLPACNTVRGMGRDVERGGEAIQEVAE